MDIESELKKVYDKSIEHLGSMSALELMKKACLFSDKLHELIASQQLPGAIITGCLMNEVHRLDTELSNKILDEKLAETLILIAKHADETFIKKEKL